MENADKSISLGRSSSFWAFLLSCSFLFSATFVTHHWTYEGTGSVLAWDVAGYYLYLPSVAYDDFRKLDKLDYIYKTYHPVDNPYLAVKQPNGNYVMKYSSGMAVMYLPGFVAGHIWAKIKGYPADGFSYPYQVANNFWGLIACFIGLWFCRKLLLRYFSDSIVAVAILLLVLATNYFFYSAFNNAVTHTYLFTVYALILYCTDQWYRKPGYAYSIALGLLCGLATLTRPTEIICVLIPLLWGIKHPKELKDRATYFLRQYKYIIAFIVCAILVGSLQLIYWKACSGHWLYYSYEDQGFSWLRPHLLNGLISYKKGWLIYTPVMLFALIGFIPLYRNHRSFFWMCLVFTLINIYITFAWDIWWYSGFTMRAMIQSYMVLMFPLAAFLEAELRKKYIVPVIVLLLFCIWYNVFMTWQVIYGIRETEMMTKGYFWRMLGKTTQNNNDLRLLDTNEVLPKKLESSLKLIASDNLQTDSLAIDCPLAPRNKVFQINKGVEYSPMVKFPVRALQHGWIRVRAKVFYPDKEWYVWRQTQFFAALLNGGKEVKEKHISIQRLTDPGVWQDLFVDIHLPNDKTFDTVAVYAKNQNSEKVLWLNDYRLYYTPQE